MKIDILSDIHFDYHFPHRGPYPYDVDSIRKKFDPLFLKENREIGEILIIAGDIGHYNDQNIAILKILKELYYKQIICVLGNHDYYLVSLVDKDTYEDSYARVKEMRELINSEEGMYCLDGNVIEINGIRFGGCDSSYSNAFIKAHFPKADHPKGNNEMWRRCMYDASAMVGINQYNQLYKEEILKVEQVYKECDVMITHVNPSYLKEHMSPFFANNITSTFFCFDGHKYLQNGTMKYWIFGHTHDKIEYEFSGVKCVCNPLGSPQEQVSNEVSIKSINI